MAHNTHKKHNHTPMSHNNIITELNEVTDVCAGHWSTCLQQYA